MLLYPIPMGAPHWAAPQHLLGVRRFSPTLAASNIRSHRLKAQSPKSMPPTQTMTTQTGCHLRFRPTGCRSEAPPPPPWAPLIC